MKIEFNERELNRVVNEDAQQAVKEERKKLQRLMDRLAQDYEGQPVPTVREALRREWMRNGGSITEPELTGWATYISEGTHIEFK